MNPDEPTTGEAEAARETIQQAERQGRRLAVTVIDDLMHTFFAMACRFQPGSIVQPNQFANEQKFREWSELALRCARELAQYQSPSLRAVAMAQRPAQKVTRFRLRVFGDHGEGRVEYRPGTRRLVEEPEDAPEVIEHDPMEPVAAPVEPLPRSETVVPIAGPLSPRPAGPNWGKALSRMRRW